MRARCWWSGVVNFAFVLPLCGCPPSTNDTSTQVTATEGTDSTSGSTSGDSESTSFTSGVTTGSSTLPTSTASLPICGDGILDGGEQCDDGNASNNDACTVTCVAASCGDGLVWEGLETCDDGNLDNDDGCLDNCTPNICGDGFINLGAEQCDDGNQVNDDDCTNACALHIPGCGDNMLDEGEECDDGNLDETDDCTPECLFNICGDGHVHAMLEQCDDGNSDEDDSCYNDCTPNICGDGILNVGVEECDDDNFDDSDDCPGNCKPALCGDGYVHEGFEKCDAGEANEDGLYNGCATDCTPNSACGDSVLNEDEGEECDDGNTISEDGCSETCTKETPPECNNHMTLSEADRHFSFNDGPGGVTKCDKTKGNWFRIDGDAGSKMPTVAPDLWSCGTDSPGWLNGTHPNVEDEVVDREVCFNWNDKPCNWSVTVQVRNCGEFFVYKLPDPPESCLRYCGDD